MKNVFLIVLMVFSFAINYLGAEKQIVITIPRLHIYAMDMAGDGLERGGFLKIAKKRYNINTVKVKSSHICSKGGLRKTLQGFLKQLIDLSETEPNAVVLLIDATRTVFFSSKDDILNTFLNSKSTLITSTTKLQPLFLTQAQLKNYPKGPKNSAVYFLDGGLVIGKIFNWQTLVARLIKILPHIEKIELSRKNSLDEAKTSMKELINYGPVVNFNHLLTMDYLAHQNDYTLDFANLFFLSLGGLEREDIDLRCFKNGLPQLHLNVKEVGGNPLVIHSQPGPNGGDDLIINVCSTVFKS